MVSKQDHKHQGFDDKMVITGTTLTIDIDMIGNQQTVELVADTSDFDYHSGNLMLWIGIW